VKRRHRRGSYAALYAIAGFVLLGFGAIAVDVAMLRLAAADAQDIADAASQAALLELRSTGSTSTASDVASLVVAKNVMLGVPPAVQLLEFGRWDDGAFVAGGARPNAVRVQVGRTVDTALARVLGVQEVDVARHAVSASRSIHTILVMDITNSWSQANFANARAAAVAFFDAVSAANGPEDRIGMVVFTGQYGVEQTPLMLVDDAEEDGVRATWDALRTASKAGTLARNGIDCNVYSGGNTNNFSTPAGGCYPNMWREYADESGTDHTTGLQMARTMFSEHDDPDAYRALLLLTDGQPNGTGAHNQRAAARFSDTRWRYYKTGTRRNTAQVQTDSVALANSMWTDQEVNLWAVSFVADATFLQTAVHGDGYYQLTASSSALIPIFQDVAESLPVAIVQ
jgi:Putative Tad-like Flp pilus-assembly